MKTVSFFVMISSWNVCNAQWIHQSTGYSFEFPDVSFVDSMNGIITSLYGPLITHDGGDNWQHEIYPAAIIDVEFINDHIVYAVGIDDTAAMFKSTDKGDSWVPILRNDYQAIHFGQSENFLNKDTGIIGTGTQGIYDGGIACTTDSGDNWEYLLTGGPIYWVRMFSFDSIKAMYSHFPTAYFLESTNHGQNWQTQYDILPDNDDVWAQKRIYFFDWLHGLYIHDWGYETFDGGMTWSKYPAIDSTIAFNTIFFVNNQTGYITGQNSSNNLKIYSTNNGGQTWIENSIDVNSTETIYAFDCLDENHCYAVGTNGLFLKTSNGGGVGINEIDQSNFDFSIYPNPATTELEIILPKNYQSQQLKITNTLGQPITQQQFSSYHLTIDISDLPTGVYFLEIQTEKEKEVKKFVKQ